MRFLGIYIKVVVSLDLEVQIALSTKVKGKVPLITGLRNWETFPILTHSVGLHGNYT